MAGTENEEARIKGRIKAIYSKLEGLTFNGSFQNRGVMEKFRLKVPRTRPVYVVKGHGVKVLDEIYREIKEFERSLGGKEIWKGITKSGDTYKLWGTEYSANHSNDGFYHVVDIEVIVNRTEKYRAVVNICVEMGKNQAQGTTRKRQLVRLFLSRGPTRFGILLVSTNLKESY